MRAIALLLDIDGTLVDFAHHPDEVKFGSDIVTLLSVLDRRLDGAIALVSGRRIDSIDRLTAPARLPCVGVHGAELRVTGAAPIQALTRAIPLAARDAIGSLAPEGLATFVEDKDGIAMAVHFDPARPASASIQGRLESIVRERADGWIVMRGRNVFEIKPHDINKGTGCRQLLAQPPFRGRRPVYLGDDTTDLDAFAAIRALGGVNISVGERIAHAAHIALATPVQALSWLRDLAAWLGGTGPAPAPELL